MFLLEIGVIGIVAASALLLVTRPLVRGARVADETLEAERAELEALKEAKYREIRDAELDYRTGKLSEADFKALDRTLRAEAIEILKRLDQIAEPLT
jgi:type II secretory pathway pseudopilin PulG